MAPGNGVVLDKLRRLASPDARIAEPCRARLRRQVDVAEIDQDAVRVHEVVDCRALAQELELEQTAKSASGLRALRRRSISRLVPTGTLDLVQMTVKPLR